MSSASWSRHGAVPTSPPPAPTPAPSPETNGEGEPALPSSSSLPPTATAAEAGVAFFSRAGVTASAAAAVGRPRAWREVLDTTAFSRPETCGEARARARRNLAYFRANYALAALLLVFLGLVYRPVSMLAFLALFLAWLALYFGRSADRLACLGRDLDDRLVLAVLAAATVLAVALTQAGLNLLVSLLLAAALIGVHAAFRMNVYLDETDAFDAAVSSSFTGSPYGYTALPR